MNDAERAELDKILKQFLWDAGIAPANARAYFTDDIEDFIERYASSQVTILDDNYKHCAMCGIQITPKTCCSTNCEIHAANRVVDYEKQVEEAFK